MAISATGRLTADEPVVRPGSVTGARTGRDRAGLMAGAAAMELALPPWSRTAAMELALPPWNRTAAMELALPPWSRAAAMELALPPCSPRRRRAARAAAVQPAPPPCSPPRAVPRHRRERSDRSQRDMAAFPDSYRFEAP